LTLPEQRIIFLGNLSKFKAGKKTKKQKNKNKTKQQQIDGDLPYKKLRAEGVEKTVSLLVYFLCVLHSFLSSSFYTIPDIWQGRLCVPIF